METFLVVALAAITAASNIWAAYETRQANFHYAEGNRIAAGGEPMPNQPKPSYKPLVVMAVLTLLTWTAVGYDVYDRHYNVQPDLREIPPAQLSSFKEALKNTTDPGDHFYLKCASDAGCQIAAKLRDALADVGWTVEHAERVTVADGLYVETPSNTDHAPQLTALRSALEHAGLRVAWYNFPGGLGKGDFILMVGPLK